MESHREQAHFPAEQPPSRKDARLPVADAHARRPGDRRRAAPQGPQRTVGLSRPSALVVLAPAHRMRRASQFRSVLTGGARARSGVLVVHYRSRDDAYSADDSRSGSAGERPDRPATITADPAPVVGLIVGKTIGTSVVRHRVSRRLRAQLAARVPTLPAGSATVVRALPGADRVDSVRLGRDLDAALFRVVAAGRPGAPVRR
jgi:ribonuclease P protein component